MTEWNPEKYLLFQKQRTQPAIDLANRVRDCNPKTVADIGCGPGNSTAILQQVFPYAEICGIDNSETMLAKARAAHSDIPFLFGSADNLSARYDLLFSNACLQWLPAHETLIPKLLSNLTAHARSPYKCRKVKRSLCFALSAKLRQMPNGTFPMCIFRKTMCCPVKRITKFCPRARAALKYGKPPIIISCRPISL